MHCTLPQLDDRRLGGLQRLLRTKRVAASLGGLPAALRWRAAAFRQQRTLPGPPSGRQAALQPLPVPGGVAGRALDAGKGPRGGQGGAGR